MFQKFQVSKYVFSALLATSVMYADTTGSANVGNGELNANRYFIGLQWAYSIGMYSMTAPEPRQDGSHSYGFLAGYERWFMEELGLRVFAIFGGHYRTQFNYGVGLDALYDFVKFGNSKMGVFLGTQLEAMQWRIYDDPMYKDYNFNNIQFNIGLNAGLRFSVKDNHLIEILAKTPFLTHEIYSKKYPIKVTEREWVNIAFRYMYRF